MSSCYDSLVTVRAGVFWWSSGCAGNALPYSRDVPTQQWHVGLQAELQHPAQLSLAAARLAVASAAPSSVAGFDLCGLQQNTEKSLLKALRNGSHMITAEVIGYTKE